MTNNELHNVAELAIAMAENERDEIARLPHVRTAVTVNRDEKPVPDWSTSGTDHVTDAPIHCEVITHPYTKETTTGHFVRVPVHFEAVYRMASEQEGYRVATTKKSSVLLFLSDDNKRLVLCRQAALDEKIVTHEYTPGENTTASRVYQAIRDQTEVNQWRLIARYAIDNPPQTQAKSVSDAGTPDYDFDALAAKFA